MEPQPGVEVVLRGGSTQGLVGKAVIADYGDGYVGFNVGLAATEDPWADSSAVRIFATNLHGLRQAKAISDYERLMSAFYNELSKTNAEQHPTGINVQQDGARVEAWRFAAIDAENVPVVEEGIAWVVESDGTPRRLLTREDAHVVTKATSGKTCYTDKWSTSRQELEQRDSPVVRSGMLRKVELDGSLVPLDATDRLVVVDIEANDALEDAVYAGPRLAASVALNFGGTSVIGREGDERTTTAIEQAGLRPWSKAVERQMYYRPGYGDLAVFRDADDWDAEPEGLGGDEFTLD